MKNKKTFVLTFVCILTQALLQSCDDSVTELEKLPPATQSGKSTFGCLVNGNAWVSEISTDVNGFYQTGTLSISAGLSSKNFNGIMSFHIFDHLLGEKTYQLAVMNRPESHDAKYYDHDTSCEFLTTNVYTGSVTITHFDNINYIISGTFEFEAYSDDCSKKIKVTHGRFDITYAP